MTREELQMPLRKVRKFYLVSLPAKLSKKFGIAEGDYVKIEETKEGILNKATITTATTTHASNPTP
jgi:AbrB family looped-hinge helix DNA binding protein